MDEIDIVTSIGLIACLLLGGILIYDLGYTWQHEEDYGLGSTVTTTDEYMYLTNDLFTGVVVRGEGWRDPALTVRNRDGEERRIATQWLTPV